LTSSDRYAMITTSTQTAPPPVPDDQTRWLALLIREGLLVIVRGIERRYHLERK
jgi:hypothetical protein